MAEAPAGPDPRQETVEADEADLAEQRRGLEDDEPAGPAPHVLDEEADEADLIEQETEVGADEDDDRRG